MFNVSYLLCYSLQSKLFYSFDEVSNIPNTSLSETTLEKSNGGPFKVNVLETHVSEPKIETKEFEELRTRSALLKSKCQDVISEQTPVTVDTSAANTVNHVQSKSKLPEDSSKIKILNLQHEFRDDKPESQIPVNKVENVKRYLYTGPPKISLSTWNERPKRQVSIKTDRDYVIGIRQRLQRNTDDDATNKSLDEDYCNKPVSRVPIVKSVELKKPYAEQLQTASPVLALSEVIKAQAKLSNGYSYHGSTVVLTGDNVNNAVLRPLEKKASAADSSYTFGKLMGRSRKPREMSANVDPRENLLESIRSFGGRDSLKKIRA